MFKKKYGENTTIRHKVFLVLVILREVQTQTIYHLSGYFEMNPFKIMQEPIKRKVKVTVRGQSSFQIQGNTYFLERAFRSRIIQNILLRFLNTLYIAM